MSVSTRDKPYKCDICGTQFSQSITFEAHVRIHTRDKPYKSYTCGAQFSQSDNLKNHIRIHTG